MTHFKLLAQLERDIRNQGVIDNLRRFNRKDRIMLHIRDHHRSYIALGIFAACWLFGICSAVRADELPKCPNPGEPCKIIFLTAQEEKMLMGQNGVLDTAAQARSLDLGQFAVYFKTRIAAAPNGEVQKAAEPAK